MPESRKLAVILAIDVSGYSRETEANDAAAAQRVRALRAEIEQTAEALGGRVFNTAGDGFMLEFATASAGLEAGVDTLRKCAESEGRLPLVRIGLHLGEVIEEANGDLLGHGVNIAARLQQLAAPGGLIVSADLWRSVRGPLAQTLRPMGAVRLAKMREQMRIYGRGPAPTLKLLLQRAKDWRLVAALAGAVGVAVLLGWTLFPWGGSPTQFALAPAAVNDPHLAALSGETAAEISNAANRQAIALTNLPVRDGADESDILRAAARARVRYVLFRSVQSQQGVARLDLRLLRSPDGLVIWSRSFEQAAQALDTLPIQVGARTISVFACLESAGHGRPGATPPDALALLANVCGVDSYEEAIVQYQAMGRAAEKAPNSAVILAAYAFLASYALNNLPAPQRDSVHAEAVRAARRAIELDPRQPYAYAALAQLEGPGQWREREIWLRQGLRHLPNSAPLHWTYGTLLRETGRYQEAYVHLARAVAIEPWAENASSYLANIHFILGRTTEAHAELDRIEQIWPDLRRFSYERLRIDLFGDDPARARSAVRAYLAERPGASSRCWNALADASFAATSESRRRAAELVECASSDNVAPSLAIQVLARRELTDEAFSIIRDQQQSGRFWIGDLFFPVTAALRRDPRFAALVEEAEILTYWRDFGWPDFCSEPGLVVACR